MPFFLNWLVSTITEGGRLFVEQAGEKIEVVIATAKQAASVTGGGEAGVYVVGSGNTGASATFMTLGIIYFIVIYENVKAKIVAIINK